MAKNVIRLTENQLKGIIEETIKKVIKEGRIENFFNRMTNGSNIKEYIKNVENVIKQFQNAIMEKRGQLHQSTQWFVENDMKQLNRLMGGIQNGDLKLYNGESMQRTINSLNKRLGTRINLPENMTGNSQAPSSNMYQIDDNLKNQLMNAAYNSGLYDDDMHDKTPYGDKKKEILSQIYKELGGNTPEYQMLKKEAEKRFQEGWRERENGGQRRIQNQPRQNTPNKVDDSWRRVEGGYSDYGGEAYRG